MTFAGIADSHPSAALQCLRAGDSHGLAQPVAEIDELGGQRCLSFNPLKRVGRLVREGISVAIARVVFFKRTGGLPKSIAGLFDESKDDAIRSCLFRYSLQTTSQLNLPGGKVARLASISTHQRSKSDG
jgi:hypothetical protein